MVSFTQSNAAVFATLLASLATTEAAYGRGYMLGRRPSTALGARMYPSFGGPSLFSRDMRRVMNDMDEMMNSMMGEMDDLFYEPRLALQQTTRPSYLLQGSPTLNALAQRRAEANGIVAKNSFGITQDDKQFQIAMDVPGASASDINLELVGDGRLLKISGETKRESEGISMHSQFERSFTLPKEVNVNEIAARMDNGVLTITAPKYEEVKESVRKIDIVENKKVEDGVEEVGNNANEEEDTLPVQEKNGEDMQPKPETDESVIDLDHDVDVDADAVKE
jgi:HSP20 family protein